METVVENAEAYEAAAKPRRGFRGLILLLAMIGAIAAGSAAGAFGLLAPAYDLLLGHDAEATPSAPIYYPLPEFRVAIAPFSRTHASSSTRVEHFRVVVQLELDTTREAQVKALEPRILDVLLSFLHALNERDLASIQSLDRLKAQMLHRVRQVTGESAVRSVLITDLTVL